MKISSVLSLFSFSVLSMKVDMTKASAMPASVGANNVAGRSSSSSPSGWNEGSPQQGYSGNNATAMEAVTSAPLMLWSTMWKTSLSVTVILYVLNQKHMLPKPLSAVVSKVLFWPTLPITISRRIGTWMTRMDDTLVMGGAPFGFMGYPKQLAEEYNVKGVINLCEEYHGPLQLYKDLGIEELHLPTTDHFEPSYEDMLSALAFIQRHKAHGNSVYVHCRAGHGRSAAIVFAWNLYQDPQQNLQDLNIALRKRRSIRKTLWKQKNILKLHERLQEKGLKILLDIDGKDTAASKKTTSSNKKPKTEEVQHKTREKPKEHGEGSVV